MPFRTTTENHTEEYWSNHFECFLKPMINEITDLHVERSKAIRTDILRDIIRDLIFSKIVLVDITDLNANVLWELGVRQSFSNGTIIISEGETPKPFDIAIKAIISYPKLETSSQYHKEILKFKDNLRIALEDCINYPDKSDSPVIETISGRGTVYEIISHDEIIRKLDGLIDEVKSNIHGVGRCIELCELNKEKAEEEKQFQFVTFRLRGHSAELLLTTRYLMQNQQFYSLLGNYFGIIKKFNTQLDKWSYSRSGTEEYIDKHFENGKDTFISILKVIEQISSEMKNQL